MFSSISFAEWIFVAETKEKNSKLNAKSYIDPDRIIFKNELVYYWQLTDWVNEGGYGYLSAVAQVVTDCDLKKYKNLQITNYKNNMGTGMIVGKDKPHTQWQYPLPSSTKESLVNYVCKVN